MRELKMSRSKRWSIIRDLLTIWT